MCKTRNVLTALLLIGALAAVCHATPSFEWVLAEEPGSVGGATYPLGYTSWDLMYTVDTHVSIVALYMGSDTPAPGDFYQNPNAGLTGPPSSGTISSDPFAEFDTYITMPGSFSTLGAAVDIVPGQRPLTFDDQLLDITWSVSVGNFSGSGTFHVARVTFKDGVSAPYTVMGWQREAGSSFISSEGILLLGDANGDGVVSMGDFTTVQGYYGNTGAADILGDANYDGTVSAGDFTSIQGNYGNGAAPPEPAAIPEPATLGLLLSGALALLGRLRRQPMLSRP